MPHRLRGLYAITDASLTPQSTVVDQVKAALEAGVRIVQFRDKHSSDEAIEQVCIRLRELCHAYDALFIIDDRAALAKRIQADGLHIGKDDVPFDEARATFSEGIIGVSCYGSVRKGEEAEKAGADYVAFGSFFPSPTKPASGIVPITVLEKARSRVNIPICAIGGINAENVHLVAAQEPDMISMVDALFNGDIKSNVSKIRERIQA
jgi:thiamine-phosphate pyrophosphorylase